MTKAVRHHGSSALVLAVALVFAAAPTRAQAQDEDEAPQRWALDGAVWMTSPIALRPGLVLGALLDGRRTLGDGPLYLGARLGVSGTTESTDQWILTHYHGLAALAAGVEGRVGEVARLRLQLDAGALVVRQNGERQQYGRLKAIGISDLRRDSWSAGPYVGADLALELAFDEPWRAVLMIGPGYTVQKIAGAREGRWLVSTALGVARAF